MNGNKDYASMLIADLSRMSDDDDYIVVSDSYQFHFANEDDVPPGKYHSVVEFVEKTKTNAGAPAYDVCYTLTPYTEFLKAWRNDSLEDYDGAQYYVKIRYKKESDGFKEFADAMYLAGLPRKFRPQEAVGVEEVVFFGYPDNCKIGTIEKRMPANQVFKMK